MAWQRKAPVRKKTGPMREESSWAWVFLPRKAGEKRFWLVKSEPTTFSFDDLLARPDQTTFWDGVRNYTARTFMRDGMKMGDQVFFYHSSADPRRSSESAKSCVRDIPITRHSIRMIRISIRIPIRTIRNGSWWICVPCGPCLVRFRYRSYGPVRN